jgi:hypothetical protein
VTAPPLPRFLPRHLGKHTPRRMTCWRTCAFSRTPLSSTALFHIKQTALSSSAVTQRGERTRHVLIRHSRRPLLCIRAFPRFVLGLRLRRGVQRHQRHCLPHKPTAFGPWSALHIHDHIFASCAPPQAVAPKRPGRELSGPHAEGSQDIFTADLTALWQK